MESKRAYLKKLIEEADSLKREDTQIDDEIRATSLQNEFMERNIEWLRNFLGLVEIKNARQSKLLESHSEDQFLFGDLVEKIFDSSLINNSPKTDPSIELEPLVKTMDDIIKDTKSVFEFYNNIPIVQTYKKLKAEYDKNQEILRNLEQQNPILEEDLENLIFLEKERNRLIIKLVTNSKKITYSITESKRIENDFNEAIKVKNEEINELNNKLQGLQKKKVEYENINKVTSKFTMSHIDIFKIPSFPVKVSKNLLTQNKFKENEYKSNIKKSNKPVKGISTFPILPLHRIAGSNKKEKITLPCKLEKTIEKVQVIENKLIKSAQLKSENSDESFAKNIETSSTESVLNKAISNININDNKIDEVCIAANCTTQNIVEQKLHNSSETTKLTEKHKDVAKQPNTTDNITITSFMDDEKKVFTKNVPTNIKRKSIDETDIPIDGKSKPDMTLKYLKNLNIDSKLQVVTPEKRFRPDMDSLKTKELIINENRATNLNLKEQSTNVTFPEVKPLKEKLPIEKKQLKGDIFNFNFDGISLDGSDKSVKPPESYDFNFDGDNMNFDVTGNENNFFQSGGNLDFASDNQFGGDCDSFKF